MSQLSPSETTQKDAIPQNTDDDGLDASELEDSSETSGVNLHDVDDDTLQLFYFYYDKLKHSIRENSGGNAKVPTKAELMEFVLNKESSS